MARAKTNQDGTSASWALLTHLLDLLADKGVLSDQDLAALAEFSFVTFMLPNPSVYGSIRLENATHKGLADLSITIRRRN